MISCTQIGRVTVEEGDRFMTSESDTVLGMLVLISERSFLFHFSELL